MFTAFVFFDIWNSLACRSSHRSIFQLGLFSNRMYNYADAMCLAGQLMVIYVPFLQSVFQTTRLPFTTVLGLFGLTSFIFIVDELSKLSLRRSERKERSEMERLL